MSKNIHINSKVKPKSINNSGYVECEDHVLSVAFRESVCYTQLEKEIPNLLGMESLKCIILDDY